MRFDVFFCDKCHRFINDCKYRAYVITRIDPAGREEVKKTIVHLCPECRLSSKIDEIIIPADGKLEANLNLEKGAMNSDRKKQRTKK